MGDGQPSALEQFRETLHDWHDEPWSPANTDAPDLYEVLCRALEVIERQATEITALKGRLDGLTSIWTGVAERLDALTGAHCTTDETAAYLANGIPFPDATDPIRG